jgi:membrane protein YqaA with SNARE-associated domain
MNKWFSKMHAWSIQCTNAKWGPWILLLFGIADASFLPLPVTTLFIALSLLNSRKTMTYLVFLTFGIVAGASIGYLAGRYAWIDQKSQFTGFAQFFINNLPGFSVEAYQKIHLLFAKWGSWILLISTATPLPYGLLSVSSGVFNLNILIFLLVTLAGHGIKYMLLAVLTRKMGPSVNRLIEFTWRPVTVIPVACIVITLMVLKAV